VIDITEFIILTAEHSIYIAEHGQRTAESGCGFAEFYSPL